MIRALRGPSRLLLCAFTGAVLSACAAGLPDVEPADIPRLEQESAADPENTDLQVQLGMARFKAGDYEAARVPLQAAVDAGNESGGAYLYLGLVQEELQDWSAARAAYNRYLVVGQSTAVREEVRKRLTLIGRNLLRAQAQQALAQEAEITATGAVTARSVAVMPLAFNSDNADLEPLIYALADMMITDFAVSNALVVLERSQVQTLIDEMALTSGGYADAATGARAGRMLRAEHVVQGVLTTLGDDNLQTDADVLNVPSNGSAGQLTEAAALEQLFDMEKAIVIRTLREILGVELTPAEEQRILENRMENVLAFLAYGRGLREMDRGNYEAAEAEFAIALSLEPGYFAGTEAAMAQTAALSDASALGTGDIAGLAGTTGELLGGLFAPPSFPAVNAGVPEAPPPGPGAPTDPTSPPGPSLDPLLGSLGNGVNPPPTGPTLDQGTASVPGTPAPGTEPDRSSPVQEVGGTDTPTVTDTSIRIIIRRPGGDQ